MAFPVIATQATSSKTTAGTTHSVSLPSGVASGDLLIIFMTFSTGSITTPTGWTLLKLINNSGESLEHAVFYKVASGSEGSTVDITTGSNNRSAHISYRITGYSGVPEVSTGVSGFGANPNPDSLTPTGGAKDYLWIATLGTRQRIASITGYPANYSGSQNKVDDTVITSVATATRNLTASSEDPGSFTVTADGYTAMTIAVPPAAGVAFTPKIIMF